MLWRAACRYAWQRRWQSALNIAGIMIGVMMVVAVDLANNSARRSFDASISMLNGSITHQVVGGSAGVPETVFTRLKTELGIRRAAPGISGQVRVNGRDLTLIGIDLVSEGALQRSRPGLPTDNRLDGNAFLALFGTPDRVMLPAPVAADLGLQAAETFSARSSGGSHELVLAAVLDESSGSQESDIMLADVAGAQFILDRAGRLDSIDMILDAAEAATLARWLPPGLALVSADVRSGNLRQLSEAFHINLLAMSLLSLLVAGLLIYNTVTLSVIQRRQTLGIFRAEGVTARQIFLLVLGENAVTGLVASSLGAASGYFLGSFLVGMVTDTVDALYFNLSVTAFQADPLVLLKGLLLGLSLSLVSAALPAWQAARSLPVTLQHQDPGMTSRPRWLTWLAVLGALLLGAGWLILLPAYGSLVTGFVALTLMVFGFCLAVPLLLYGLLHLGLATGRAWLGLPGVMALRNARLAINRSGLAVAALCVAISVTVGVGVMVSSFRQTVIAWLDQSLPGDIQVTAVAGPAVRDGISPDLRDAIAAMAGVSAVHNSLLSEVETPFGPVRLGVNDIPAEAKFYLASAVADGEQAFNRGEGVFISEPLAYQQRLVPGDGIGLLTERGMTTFPILGVFHDYTSGSGLVHMHESLFRQFWTAQPFARLTLETVPGFSARALQQTLDERLAAEASRFNVVANGQLRELTLQIFDRTFAITNVLRLLSILVAFVGVVSTLMALQLEKQREFAILRATGMTSGQVAGLIFKQTAALGICAGLLALPLGLLMSDVLIDVINRRSFGWSMQHFLPANVLAEGFVLALFAALLAGVYPAWRAGRILPAAALREE